MCIRDRCGTAPSSTYECPPGASCRYVQVTSTLWDQSTMTCTFKNSVGTIFGVETFQTNTTAIGQSFYGETGSVTVSCVNSTSGEQANDSYNWP